MCQIWNTITDLLQKKNESPKTEKRVEVCRKEQTWLSSTLHQKKMPLKTVVIPERNQDTWDDVLPGTADQIFSSPLGKAVVIFGFFITYRHWDIINLSGGDNPLYLSRTSPRSAGKQPVARQGRAAGALKQEQDAREWEPGPCWPRAGS